MFSFPIIIIIYKEFPTQGFFSFIILNVQSKMNNYMKYDTLHFRKSRFIKKTLPIVLYISVRISVPRIVFIIFSLNVTNKGVRKTNPFHSINHKNNARSTIFLFTKKKMNEKNEIVSLPREKCISKVQFFFYSSYYSTNFMNDIHLSSKQNIYFVDVTIHHILCILNTIHP